jgi:phage gp46-like protein
LTQQQGDVQLTHTADGAEIAVVDGLVAMDSGLYNAVYLSLFGGDDWWGNDGEPPAQQYQAETGALLDELTAIPFHLRRIEQAAERDLAWMVDEGVAAEIAVAAELTSINRIHIVVTIDGDETLDYSEVWAYAADNANN